MSLPAFYLNGSQISEEAATDLIAREISAHGHDVAHINGLFARVHAGSQFAADDLAMYAEGLEIIVQESARV